MAVSSGKLVKAGAVTDEIAENVPNGRPPLANLSDMVPVMRLVDDAYAKAKALPLLT